MTDHPPSSLRRPPQPARSWRASPARPAGQGQRRDRCPAPPASMLEWLRPSRWRAAGGRRRRRRRPDRQRAHGLQVATGVHVVHPGAVDGRPQKLPRAQLVGGDIAHVLRAASSGVARRRAEAVGAEAGARPVVEEPDGCRAVEQRRPERVQGSVTDFEALAGVEEVDAIQRQRVFGGHEPAAEERRHQAGVGSGLEEWNRPPV